MRAWVDVAAVVILLGWALGGAGLRPSAASLGRSTAYDPRSFIDPWAVTLSPDGNDLYVAVHAADRVLRLDTRTGKILATAHVEEAPAAVILDSRARRVYVPCENAASVETLDARSLDRLASRAVDPFPQAGVVLRTAGDRLGGREARGETLFLAHHHSDILSSLDLATGEVLARIPTGSGPSCVVPSPDGSLLLVGSFYSLINDPRLAPVCEITGIDVARARVAFRIPLDGATLIRHGAFTPDGETALLGMQRSKNVIPNVAVGEGWSMTHGLVVLTRRHGALDPSDSPYDARQVLLDGLEEGNAEPYDVAISPDGKRAFVACQASRRVLVLDVARLLDAVRSTPARELPNRLDLLDRFLIASVPTPPGPRALAMAPDGKHLYVALSLAQGIGVIDTNTLSLRTVIHLAPERPETQEPPERRGERIFHSAAHSCEGRMSCNSCHPEGHQDGLSANIAAAGLGKNRVRIKTLLNSSGTEPFKWSGLNAGYYAQCGPRAAKLILHSTPLSLPDLDDLVAYLRSLRLPPNPFKSADGTLTPAQEHGRRIFERDTRTDGTTIPPIGRCSFCHPGPRFTNRRAFDVGTKVACDTSGTFDTPQLENLFMTRPFLHDGRASTLEAIFTQSNPDDKHGVANDLGKDDLNDLVDYMRTLGPRAALPRPVESSSVVASQGGTP